MKLSKILLVLFLLVPMIVTMIPVKSASAGYRIGPVATDVFPGGTGTAQINSIAIGDASGLGSVEIVTAGQRFNGTFVMGEIRVYQKSGSNLVLEGNRTLIRTPNGNFTLSQVAIADLDGNGNPDIVFVGNSQTFIPQKQAHLGIYRWTGATFIRERLSNFTGSGPATPITMNGLAIWAKGGVTHMVTAGFAQTGSNAYNAQLGVWQWDGITFTRKTLYNWTTPGGWAKARAVAVGDVNGDGTPDIVTVGNSYNGTMINTQLRVWSWDGSSLNAIQTREWTSNNEIPQTVTIKDANGDAVPEIVVGDTVTQYPYIWGHLSVWSDSSSTLAQLAESKYLSSPGRSTFEIITGIGVAPVDNSGKSEIITAGFTDIPQGSTDIGYAVIRTWTWDGSSLVLVEASIDSQPFTAIPLALAVADVDADGKPDMVIGGQTVSANIQRGILQVRDVAYVYGTIALSTSPSPALAGQSVTVSGSLSNQTNSVPISSAQVLLEYSQGGSAYQLIGTIDTDSLGRFATSFTPPGPGTYTIRSTWNGMEGYMSASNTVSLTVSKAPSVIILYASSLNLKPGDSVTVKGYVYPASAANVTLAYTDPSGATTTHTVTSDNTGAFNDQITVSTAGAWKVSASWTGTSTTQAASSDAVQVIATPDPLALTLGTYGFIIAIGALAVGAVALIRARRSPQSGGSSPTGPSVRLYPQPTSPVGVATASKKQDPQQ